ncbi:MAG: tRNA (guanosine(37)-N1)-methyltransferase TrmD [Centipeda sp. (in: firmicutes)]|uniref:tRNA (guanosine(37)-N1)-methyltransferase TrmD n=1 Tax=Selenomonas sp. oral taxon 920 TaxID=1884263 RepID=UPI000840B6F2|nr:tRNA (guanosine(37)-N1)-methyltransferase TrmD [Selenomonas sp. oral taxon 920]AOH48227.1 tRNA (guanosine(37)-N1)-methyltransferase TrmD [Selenomonas sp. oral taxon 920]
MRIDLVTLFPEMFAGVFGTSIIGRATERGALDIHYTNFRDYSTDKHRHVDDTPCGGGAGMVLKPEPLYAAVRDIWAQTTTLAERRCTIIFDPAGEVFTQKTAKELAGFEQLILICGHYEGFDQRVYDLADRMISVGDFVLTGGEIPAMLVVDATARMLPGVLGDDTSAPTDSFFDVLLGCPQYTRPREFEGKAVPDVLLSGNHAEIARWRREQSLLATLRHRPELLPKARLTMEDLKFLAKQNEHEE